MAENTIIKPRPGARQALSPNSENGAADNKTVFASPAGGVSKRERFRLPATRLGPVCDKASKLLSVADRLGEASLVENIDNLKRQCMELVREYQRALKSMDLMPDTIDTASYCTCALLDEMVLNSKWGQSGQWAANSLLSEFHGQTWAGTSFFELVEKSRRVGNIPLLTLQYLCLSLGFKGKYRVEERGQEQLDTLRDSIYQQLCADKGRFTTPFDRSWQERVVAGNGLASGIPLWVGAAICAVVLVLGYIGFSHKITEAAQPVLNDITRIGVPSRTDSIADGAPPDLLYMQQILKTEIDRNLLELEVEGNRLRLLIGTESLFASGTAAVREDISPVLGKVARVLESTKGSILVTGHTDDRPIATTRYPSNWHLSLARATSVADFLASTADLNGRLWPEGRGHTRPRFDNDTVANRARNRRVEITLIPEL
jgi:type VI secretion system protein ImpK